MPTQVSVPVVPLRQFSRLPALPDAGPGVALTPHVEQLIAANAVVAVGVSGGKDSQACALAVNDHLNAVGHIGPRVLIHADLGVVEWKDSLPCCERLAEHLGWELITVRRAAGDMLDRWRGRWKNNVARYADLSCVKLILPWSTPAMRFCTSELKSSVLASALKKRFPGQDILDVVGIRHEESPSRAKMPIGQPNARLRRKDAEGFTWNAIIHWKLGQVLDKVAASELALHEAYTRYLSSRVSCVFCVMGSGPDLVASTSCEDNQPVYRLMVDLELESTFAFQGNRWLADVAPHLLTPEQRVLLPLAKERALRRQEIEAALPKHLLFTKGWPTAMPSPAEAQLLADVRRQVAQVVGLQVGYTDAPAVLERYAELLSESQGDCDAEDDEPVVRERAMCG